MEAAPRQTLSYLRDLFEARGLRPKKNLGQCFLIDLNLLNLILETAEISRNDFVIEIGTGTGSMTTNIAERAGAVLGVEIDDGFYALTRTNTAAFPHVRLLHTDILGGKNQINAEVLQAITEGRERFRPAHLKLVSNLPYVVATPVISNFLLTNLPFERFVVTIQWELAERLIAAPSTKDYSSLSVLVQSLASVNIIRRVPPAAFWPRPKVDSAIVLIRPDATKRAQIRDLPYFHRFLRDLYLHRRKNLRGALLPMVRERLSKDQLDQRLVDHGFDPSGRAEALTVAEHLKLSEAVQ